jgi:hypothetical protein
MYGRRSKLGSIAVRFAAILAVAVVFIGLLNRPNGDWSPAISITPHSHSCPGSDCASGR